jgi:ADP-ribosylglycohydrolase
VGSVYEFNNIKTKDFPLFSKKSFATDDSIMTLAIASALMDAAEDGSFDVKTDAEWIASFRDSMRRIGIPYPYCGYGGRFLDWMYSEDPQPYESCGNGSAMRVSPVGWFARSIEECERLARLTAEPTHNHPDGIAGAQAAAGAVFLARNGASRDEIKAYVEKYYKIGFTLDEIRPEYHFGHFQALCKGTVPYAVEAFLESADFEDCIRNTISIGGDSDTLAAISGAIAEAFYGEPAAFYSAVVDRLDSDLRAILRRLDKIEWPKEAKS